MRACVCVDCAVPQDLGVHVCVGGSFPKGLSVRVSIDVTKRGHPYCPKLLYFNENVLKVSVVLSMSLYVIIYVSVTRFMSLLL